MPYPQVLFMNAPSLSLATSVFTDSNMNYCAPDGWYTDGVVVRQQIACQLGPAESCPSCVLNCQLPGNTTDIDNQVYGSGIYKIPMYSTLYGAIIIRVTSSTDVIGIRAYNNLITVNTLSTDQYTPATDGYLRGIGVPVPNLPVYIGNEVDRDNCGLPNDPGGIAQIVLPNYTYEATGTFSLTGATLENIYFEQIYVGPGTQDPWMAWMVLPKPTSVSNDYTIEVYSPCNANWEISVSCPQALPSVKRSKMAMSSGMICSSLPGEYLRSYDMYFVSVSGYGPAIGLNDWVFVDSFGQTPLPDGYYSLWPIDLSPGFEDIIRVLNGRVVELISC